MAALAVLLAMAWAVFGPARHLPPLSGDNLYILDWVARHSAWEAIVGDPALYPEWRPLPYLTVWLQYQWTGLGHVGGYFVVNLVLWASAAWMAWRLAVRYGVAPGPALVAGALVLADPRGVVAVVCVVERQMSLACLFGLGALLLSTSVTRPASHRAEGLALTLLLLASALSKEFGLAFAAAVGIEAWRDRRVDRGVAVTVALVAYAALRTAFTYGGPMRLCEEMGYFGELRAVCFWPPDRVAVSQMAYNVVATAADSLVPGVLSPEGRIVVIPAQAGRSLVWLALAAVGWRRGAASTRTVWTLMVATAALNVMLYRDRNHLVALCGMAIAAAAGLQALAESDFWKSRPVRVMAALALVALLLPQAQQTHDAVLREVQLEASEDPCTELGLLPHLDRSFVRHVKLQYGLPNPDCVIETPTPR